VLRHRDSGRRVVRPFLHHDVTATPTNLNEPLSLENLADLVSGQNPTLTQPRPRRA
jgi:hypothetical protein